MRIFRGCRKSSDIYNSIRGKNEGGISYLLKSQEKCPKMLEKVRMSVLEVLWLHATVVLLFFCCFFGIGVGNVQLYHSMRNFPAASHHQEVQSGYKKGKKRNLPASFLSPTLIFHFTMERVALWTTNKRVPFRFYPAEGWPNEQIKWMAYNYRPGRPGRTEGWR